MKVILYYLAALVLLFSSCQDKDKHGKPLDTPTSGSIKIVADESLRPLVEAEVTTFNGIYTKAHVEVTYLPEAEAINALLQDSVRLAIVARKLSPEEKKYISDKTLRAREEEVALSGIAVIVNPASNDSLISVDQLRSILQGNTTNWSQLGSKRKAGIEIVFDNPNSGLVRHLKDSIAKVKTLPANCFAAQNNEGVVDYVSKNVNALGLIGVEWISDKDDSTSNSFLSKVRVAGVAGDSTHFQPYQAYIALKYYPLMRKVTIINTNSRTGLAYGFAAFFASERGQRIVLKSGLVPVTMPLRIINVNPTSSFKIER